MTRVSRKDSTSPLSSSKQSKNLRCLQEFPKMVDCSTKCYKKDSLLLLACVTAMRWGELFGRKVGEEAPAHQQSLQYRVVFGLTIGYKMKA
ncbi:hypothetical protein PIB30_012235 [Stylosanthes scabra]|uniref:Uncharacterized protein n=1 Tax=Stylosanthes scabra TaxID=79078 RepID=A0ABU6V7V8_9FABA|nr:hypothetical protein [Stylosanthes scabra]